MTSSNFRYSDTTRGLLWIVLAGLLFVIFVGLVRYVGNAIHPVQAAFIRYALGLIVLAPLFIRYGMGLLHTTHLSRHMWRGGAHAVAVMLWFYATTQLPLAEVTALSFVAPIFVVIGASLFLGEQLTPQRVIIVILGLIGVLIILRPGYIPIGYGAIAMLLAAPLFALSKLLTKFMVRDESSGTIVAHLSIFATLTMLLPAIYVWQQPTLNDMVVLAGTAIFATLSHLCLARGLRLVDVTVAQPVEFLQLVWSTLLGFVFFSEQPSLWVWLGAGVIVASATYIARHESVANSNKPVSA